jgi:ketohexokinase
MRYLRQVSPACTISVEVEKPGREGLVELAAEANVVFYSRGWAEVRRCVTSHEGRKLNRKLEPGARQSGGVSEGRGGVIAGVSCALPCPLEPAAAAC